MRRRRPSPRRTPASATSLALALAATAVVLTGCSGQSPSGARPSPTGVAGGGASAFDGAALPAGVVAPAFTLTDQAGRAVSLAQYRGRVVVLTFLYSTCGATCALIAQQIRGALDELPRPVPVLIVSADPAADSPARVRRFLSQASLSGRAEYLSGPASRLRRVWAAYRVKPASVGSRVFGEYASVLLIDPEGTERVLFQSEQLTPEALSHDIEQLGRAPIHP